MLSKSICKTLSVPYRGQDVDRALCDELTLHVLSHLRQVSEEHFNIIVCKAGVVGVKGINLARETQFCCRRPFLMQDNWFQHKLGIQKGDSLFLTENVLHRVSGMGGNFAKVDVTILCIPHKS
jgi:hypothetical protein